MFTVFVEKNPNVSGPSSILLFKGQLYSVLPPLKLETNVGGKGNVVVAALRLRSSRKSMTLPKTLISPKDSQQSQDLQFHLWILFQPSHSHDVP